MRMISSAFDMGINLTVQFLFEFHIIVRKYTKKLLRDRIFILKGFSQLTGCQTVSNWISRVSDEAMSRINSIILKCMQIIV